MEKQEVEAIISKCQSATEFSGRLYPEMAKQLAEAPNGYAKGRVKSAHINRAKRLCAILNIAWPNRFSRRGRKIPSVNYIKVYENRHF